MRGRVWGTTVCTVAVASCFSDCPLTDFSIDLGALTADAGFWLRDAGALLVEAGLGTVRFAQREAGMASAQSAGGELERYDVGCDEVYEWKQSSGYATDVTTNFYARAHVDSTEDIVAVDVRLCNREVFGQDATKPTCADGFACTGASAPEPTECVVQTGAELGPNFVRASCGSHALSTYSGTQSEHGSRWRTVHMVVRRR
jgi:hypothetical protein